MRIVYFHYISMRYIAFIGLAMLDRPSQGVEMSAFNPTPGTPETEYYLKSKVILLRLSCRLRNNLA